MGTLAGTRERHLPKEKVKARFASIITLLFARKESKSLPPVTFHWLRNRHKCVCKWDSARNPAGGADRALIGPLAGFKGPLCVGKEGQWRGEKGMWRG